MAEEERKTIIEEDDELETEEFGELIKYTGSGFMGGLLLGAVLDFFEFQTSAWGQWIVRTFSGEGESIFEGIFAIKKRMTGTAGSIAEAYGWGKFFGMAFPWIVDWISRFLGIDVYGIKSFYIPFFYALSDQIGANISGIIFMYKQEGAFLPAMEKYLRHPVMMTSLTIIVFVPAGLFISRYLGFIPDTQVYTALETIVANLCWVPPLVGWLMERKIKKFRKK